MGQHEDHRKTVADRWGLKYRESGITADEFGEYMRKTMLKYGWSETDAAKMVARAIRRGDGK